MKTIKMQVMIGNETSSYWEEYEVDDEINAKKYLNKMVSNFNDTLREGEQLRTIVKIIDLSKPKHLQRYSKKDYGYKNSFDGPKYQRLRRKVKKQHNLDMPEFAVRQFGGKWMAARGQWSWHTVVQGEFLHAFGSQEGITKLLKYHCLDVKLNDVGEYDIDGCTNHKETKK